MKKMVVIFLSVLLLFTASGCWDQIQIEERGYVLGVAIDRYPPIPKGLPDEISGVPGPEEDKDELEIMDPDTEPPLYAMTIQIPIIKKATLAAMAGGGGEGADGSKTWNLTQAGNSFIDMSRQIAARLNYAPYYEHTQVIIISEDIAREGIGQVLDLFLRDHEMRRRVRVMITPGEAKKILDVEPRIEDYSAIYLAKLRGNARKNNRMVFVTDLGLAAQNIVAGVDFVLPRVVAVKDEIKYEGAAVFKGDKMVGWMDGKDVKGGRFIRDMVENGIITAVDPDDPQAIITYEISRSSTKVTPVIVGDDVKFIIDIKVEGNYAETSNRPLGKRIDEDYLERAEQAFARSIKKLCQETIDRIQGEFGADVLHFSVILRTREPGYWKEVEDRWHDLFPYVDTEVNVDLNIRKTGHTR